MKRFNVSEDEIAYRREQIVGPKYMLFVASAVLYFGFSNIDPSSLTDFYYNGYRASVVLIFISMMLSAVIWGERHRLLRHLLRGKSAGLDGIDYQPKFIGDFLWWLPPKVKAGISHFFYWTYALVFSVSVTLALMVYAGHLLDMNFGSGVLMKIVGE